MPIPSVAYLLGAYWYDNDPRDQTSRFVENGIWENGYQTEYLDLVKSIPVGSPVFIKSSLYHNGLKTSVLRVKARGTVTENRGDGRNLSVDWEKGFAEENFTDKDVPGVGRYRDTVELVSEPSHLAALVHQEFKPEVRNTPPATLDFPRNQILYGPPGTGKTYHTATRAVGIIEGLTDAEVKARYVRREQVTARLQHYRDTGQVAFVTFHQAFGYEDFVEGIKPVLIDDDQAAQLTKVGYELADGLFLRLCNLATYALRLKHRQQLPRTTKIDFDTSFNELYDQLLQDLNNDDKTSAPLSFETKTGPEIVVVKVEKSSKIYFQHKASKIEREPYLIRRENLKKLYDTFGEIQDIKNVYKDIIACIGNCNASGYWALLNHLKMRARGLEYAPLESRPVEEQLWEAQRNYDKVKAETKGVDFSKFTREDIEQAPRFVLVIDEINRGNVANIFGELITLLEDDKRAGQPEALTVRLPYSKEDFTVPDNLYLLGTMNTADRSVEALDTALRRRFSFSEMRPEADVIRRQVGTNGRIGAGDEAVDVALVLEVMNSRLEQLLDRDHCLGHALLLLPAPATLAGLREAFGRKILPLLQEYFFGDFGKIGLVLGPDFVEVVKANAPGRHALAKLPGYDAAGLGDKRLYRLADLHARTAADFRRIYDTPTA